jgi:RNA polymerase sigma-70 factor (ECF subfamily)
MKTIADGRQTEADLVERLRAGDEDAYAFLVRTQSDAMTAVARRFLVDPDEVADAVQEAFVSAFRSMGTFAGTARLGTWLHRITVNACLMKIRGRKRNRLLHFDEACHSIVRPATDRLVRSELVDQVRACIDQLPPAYRTVICLRDIDGMDMADAADRLGTNVGAVKVRLCRARHALRSLLESLADVRSN